MATQVAPAAAPDAVNGQPRTRPVVLASGLGKRFGDAWVVRDLDFAVQPGTIFGLFGPSGSGKTTTIRLVLGLHAPDDGSVSVLGVGPKDFDARTRSRIGYMPQLFVLYPELSVSANLHLVASLYGMSWWRRRRIREELELVELWEHRSKAARVLSGGMQRRLQLAAALLHRPELLVVDEPTAGIDPILRAKFWEHFRALRDEGRTIVVTSQYTTEAEYCDRVTILRHGQAAASGTPDSLRHQAMGGEVVDVVADGLSPAVVRGLAALPDVRRVEPVSFEQVRLTVASAGVAIPIVLAALVQHGITARQVREYRPNFDEVFVRIVGEDDAARAD